MPRRSGEPDARLGAGPLIVIYAAIFVSSLDNIAVSTALPELRQYFRIDHAAASWIINAYTLPFAVCMLAAAALAASAGQERLFRLGGVLFSVASLGCALSFAFPALIAARFAQGLAAAALVPLGTSLAMATATSTAHRAKRAGTIAAVQGAATILGPFLGGAIIEATSWRALFALNVPLLLVLPFVRSPRSAPTTQAAPTRMLRVLPSLLVGLSFIILGLLRAAPPWESAWVPASFLVLGGVLITVFLRADRRNGAMLLPLTIRRSRPFARLGLSNLAVTTALFAALICLLQYLQHQYSPARAGLLTLPCTAMPIAGALLNNALGSRRSPETIARIGAALQAVGFTAVALGLAWHDAYSTCVPGMIAAGLGIGLYTPSGQVLAFEATPQHLTANVTAITATTKELGILLGSVLAAVLLATNTSATNPSANMPAIAAVCAALTGLGVLLLPRRQRILPPDAGARRPQR